MNHYYEDDGTIKRYKLSRLEELVIQNTFITCIIPFTENFNIFVVKTKANSHSIVVVDHKSALFSQFHYFYKIDLFFVIHLKDFSEKLTCVTLLFIR